MWRHMNLHELEDSAPRQPGDTYFACENETSERIMAETQESHVNGLKSGESSEMLGGLEAQQTQFPQDLDQDGALSQGSLPRFDDLKQYLEERKGEKPEVQKLPNCARQGQNTSDQTSETPPQTFSEAIEAGTSDPCEALQFDITMPCESSGTIQEGDCIVEQLLRSEHDSWILNSQYGE
ncbi:hypothetical protein QAD02_008665 [Eretmocerus hayati]|uniref:Uncharacterized protein n=1 Tax=Eretmocerus hayati TaxID=131215 RepID=A0ACC2N7Q9_9HYME|nr:hypothetical protein QAD02_008665 [Eretmocerus hayati]